MLCSWLRPPAPASLLLRFLLTVSCGSENKPKHVTFARVTRVTIARAVWQLSRWKKERETESEHVKSTIKYLKYQAKYDHKDSVNVMKGNTSLASRSNLCPAIATRQYSSQNGTSLAPVLASTCRPTSNHIIHVSSVVGLRHIHVLQWRLQPQRQRSFDSDLAFSAVPAGPRYALKRGRQCHAKHALAVILV